MIGLKTYVYRSYEYNMTWDILHKADGKRIKLKVGKETPHKTYSCKCCIRRNGPRGVNTNAQQTFCILYAENFRNNA